MQCKSVHKLLHTVRIMPLTEESQKHTELHRSWELWAWKGCAKGDSFSSLCFRPSTANKPWMWLHFFIIRTRQKTLKLKQYFGSYSGTNIPSRHAMYNSPKVKKNPISKTYEAWEAAKPFLFPKPWSIPTPNSLLLLSLAQPCSYSPSLGHRGGQLGEATAAKHGEPG